MPLSQTQLDIISVLKKAKNILILPSSPIDADSIGSALSLYLAFKKLGKTATIIAEEEVPATYNFLPEVSAISHDLNFVRDFIVTIDCRDMPPGTVRHEIQGNKINIIITPQKGSIEKEQVSFGKGGSVYDCIITVDAADPSQFKKVYDNFTELFHLVPVINIDHHTSNNSFGKINFVDIMAPSTTTLILPLIEELGPNLMDADIATLLLAGLITDTGSFQNPNTTPDAFSIAAKLIGYGARQQEIIRNIYKTKKLSTLRLWGRTLSKIQNDEQHRLVWSILTTRDFAEIGSAPDETEGVIDELMGNAPGAEIIFLLKEKGPQEISGSIRTLIPTIDASKLAALFGGGGHMQAAGFKMNTTIQEAETEVVKGLKKIQADRLKLMTTSAPARPVTPPASPFQPKPEPTVLPDFFQMIPKPKPQQTPLPPKPAPTAIPVMPFRPTPIAPTPPPPKPVSPVPTELIRQTLTPPPPAPPKPTIPQTPIPPPIPPLPPTPTPPVNRPAPPPAFPLPPDLM